MKPPESHLLVSVVIPVYQAEASLSVLYRRLTTVLDNLTDRWEIVLVDDGSRDRSWATIRRIASEDPRVRGLSLTRNFGQYHALTAGLDRSRGEWTVVMDCDLQDPPEAVPELLSRAREGHDVVQVRRMRRRHPLFRIVGSRLFHVAVNAFTGRRPDPHTANFGIYSRRVIDQFNRVREQTRSLPLIIDWLGFTPAYIDVDHGMRAGGEGSTYSLSRLAGLFFDSIVAHSDRPLKAGAVFGAALCAAGLAYGAFLAAAFFTAGRAVTAASAALAAAVFGAGLLFSYLGLIGVYLGKVYEETKNRPLYVVRDSINVDGERPDQGGSRD